MSAYVQVPVPEEHVPKVYELLARLDRGDATQSEDQAQVSDAEPAPVPELDEALVKRMYDESYDRHRQLMELLASNAGEWLYSNELVGPLKLTSGSKSVAGMFGAFGRRAKHRYGGVKPWDFNWDQERGEGQYRMRPEVAAWIKAAATS